MYICITSFTTSKGQRFYFGEVISESLWELLPYDERRKFRKEESRAFGEN